MKQVIRDGYIKLLKGDGDKTHGSESSNSTFQVLLQHIGIHTLTLSVIFRNINFSLDYDCPQHFGILL